MIPHPERDLVLAAVKAELQPKLEFASRLLAFWFQYPKDKWLSESGLKKETIHVAMSLNIQICRLLSSVIEECGQAEGITATIATRSMFESFMALMFVISKRVKVAAVPVAAKPGGPPGPPKFRAHVIKRGSGCKAVPPDRDLRTALYIAHWTFQESEFHARCGKTPGLKRLAKSKAVRVDPVIIANHEAVIGPEWTYILRNHPHTYSGLSVRNLAQCLKPQLLRWYETLYPLHSRKVHSTDSLVNLKPSENGISPRWFSSVDELDSAITLSVLLFRVTLRILQENIGFGNRLVIALNSFASEWATLDPD
jgi:hypothetical protein